MGAEKQANKKVGRRQRRQAPRRAPQWLVEPPTPGVRPRRVPAPQVQPVPRPTQPRGCKGRSPLHEITLVPPLPRRGRGQGDRGQKSKLKAGSAGDKQGKPSAGHRNGWSSRQRRGYALVGCLLRRFNPCRVPSSPGDARGEAPCIRKLKSPLPTGKGSGGWGQESKLKAGLAGDQQGKPPATERKEEPPCTIGAKQKKRCRQQSCC